MSNQEMGRVELVSEKDGQYGKMYSVKVDGNYYGAGKYPPKCKQGDNIQFDWVAKGNYRNLDPKSIKVVAGGGVPQASPAAGAPAARSGGGFDERQDTISKQAACNTALNMLDILRQADAIPGIKKTATADDKYDIYRSLANKLASEYYELNTGKKWELPEISQNVADEGGAPADEQWG